MDILQKLMHSLKYIIRPAANVVWCSMCDAV